MTSEERIEIGQDIKDFLKSHASTQADLARELSRRIGISFKAAEVKVSRIIRGEYEADYDFWACVYEKFEANIGFLITKKGEPHVKPFK